MVQVSSILALSELRIISDNPNFILLNLPTSVYVFHSYKRFSRFANAVEEQGLMCGIQIILIKEWGEVSLQLKIQNCVFMLTLKRITFILDFPLNLILLTGLEDQGFDWSHGLRKI